MRRSVLVAAAPLVFLAGALALGWWRVDGPAAAPAGTTAPARPAELPLPIREMDFSLIDDQGRRVAPEDLLGAPSLVFFGFTFCPDVCPTTLAEISGWLDALGEDASRFNAVFVTVDPERDTVEVVADYVAAFHPQIRGWTGAPAEIARAANGFSIEYEKVPDGAGGYAMDHSAGVRIYDAAGELVSIVDPHEPDAYALPKLRRALDRG